MDSELLALHWMEHSTIFSQAIGNLRSKATYTDATLACEGHFYPVHKFVLSTCSQYFSAIFEWTPCINPVVVINNITCKELETLLDFMYIGEVSVKDSMISDVMRAAECLKIRGLAMVDDESVRSQLKSRSKSSGGPVRKRKRTYLPKKKEPTTMPQKVSVSPCRPSQSGGHFPCSPPPATSVQHLKTEGTSNQSGDSASDFSPDHHIKSQLSESHNHENDLAHTPVQNNAPSHNLSSQLSPSESHFKDQSLKSLHTSPSDSAVNHHSQISPTHQVPSCSSGLNSSTHEETSEVTENSVKKENLEDDKTHSPPASSALTSEIPDLLDSFADMRPMYDSKPGHGDEVATFHSAEHNENLFEFTEQLAAGSGASQPKVSFQKNPTTSGTSKTVDPSSREDNPALKCPECGKQFQKRDSFTRHLRIHSKEPYACKQCPFVSKTYRGALEHKKKEHPSVFKCTVCDFSSYRFDNVKRHMANVHNEHKPHQCPECSFSTKRPHSLQKHIKSKHEKVEKK